jgi:putative SOS response-associated peptidase YedK
MCGRYYRRSDKQKIAEAFHVRDSEGVIVPPWDYNVAPTTFQPVIRNTKETGERELVLMRWGLVPHYAKSLEEFKGFSTINARAESILRSTMWSVPFQRRRRCLVPADGFYEWKNVDPKTKQPYAFSVTDGEPFAFAGLWDVWKEPDGGWLQSYSIITTDANEIMEPVHKRMPVILHPRDYDRWLAREPGSVEGRGHGQLPTDLLRPYEAEDMKMGPVNQKVGNVRNNGPEMLNSA